MHQDFAVITPKMTKILCLESNGSVDHYPGNRAETFTNLINRFYMYGSQLDGDIEIAITEIFLPKHFTNIRPGNNTISIWLAKNDSFNGEVLIDAINPWDSFTKEFDIIIQPAFWGNLSELVQTINKELQKFFKVKNRQGLNELVYFVYHAKTKKVSFFLNKINYALHFSQDISGVLGFNPSQLYYYDRHSTNPMLQKKEIVGPYSAYPEANKTILSIYCDIVQDSMITNKRAKILTMVSYHPESEKHIEHIIIDRPIFLPVIYEYFDSITINIADGAGNPIPFYGGSTVLKLEVRNKPK